VAFLGCVSTSTPINTSISDEFSFALTIMRT